MTSPVQDSPGRGPVAALARWFDTNCASLGREMRLSYLPPLMVYLAAGVSGLTGIVGTFYVKERLGLSAEFLAALGFWLMLPWALKMPLGHLVDLIWRWKGFLVYLGALLIAASLLIMVFLLGDPVAMEKIAPAETWYVTSALLAPIGFVLQDVVADAMTVEAVPRFDAVGQPIDQARRKSMHTTMQTLGRVAIIGGTVLVAIPNFFLFDDIASMTQERIDVLYQLIYKLALVIPVISVFGVVFASWLRRRAILHLQAQGHSLGDCMAMVDAPHERPPVNWWILGGGLAFTIVSLSVGLLRVPGAEEIVFAVSMGIVTFLMWRLSRELEPAARNVLVGTAIIIFVFRATPSPGAGQTWWMIDELGFDQRFLTVLGLIGSSLTLFGLFLFRRFMAERSIAYIIGFLTVTGTFLAAPIIGMFYGLHEWTAAHTGGVVDARFIALVDTALDSPLGQIAMVPMLAWIANSAPDKLKATFFAVMASFTNLALSAAQLGTKYLNQAFVVTREVKDRASNVVTIPADYGDLGTLMIVVTLISLALPFIAIAVVRLTRFRDA